VTKLYMLDTDICSYIMREHPQAVVSRLQQAVEQHCSIVISAITYSELRIGAIGKQAPPRHNQIVDEFIERLDLILPWDQHAVDRSAQIKKALNDAGIPIGNNDTLIAAHAISVDATLVTHNVREFRRVNGLNIEEWL
jgi:tRNA(fMet)-specific endonuclease VapC